MIVEIIAVIVGGCMIGVFTIGMYYILDYKAKEDSRKEAVKRMKLKYPDRFK